MMVAVGSVRTLLLVFGVLVIGRLALADPLPREGRWHEARLLSESLMSPFCPGLTLAACTSPGAGALREELARRLDAGESESSIVDDLIARFGSRVTGLPERQGSGALAWILPPAAGLLILLLAYGAGRRRTVAAYEEPAADDERMTARLDEELFLLDA